MEYHALTLDFWITGTFWVAVAVVVFVLLFGRKIISPINKMLDQRAADIRVALDEAARLKAEAEAMLADALHRQEQAKADAAQILSYAHAEAARMAEELSREAEATARRRRQMAEERIAAAEKTALHEVHNIAAEVATAAAAQMLREGYGAEQDAQLLDHAIAHIPAALSQKIQAL
jgi:F-type H+-transporting ATPase subunit b